MLTIKQVSKVLNVHPDTVRRLVNGGTLHAYRVGKQWRISADALNNFLKTIHKEDTNGSAND